MNKNIEEYLNSAPGQFRQRYTYTLRDKKAARTRPVLTYMSGDTLRVERNSLDGLALACELLHNMSLIMDDLPGQDNSEIRRGKAAVHIRFGEGRAQMAALAMLIDALGIIADIDATNSLDGRLNTHVNDCIGSRGMCLGQDQDLETFGQDIKPAYLDEISYLKTGRVMDIGIIGASIIGGLPAEITDILGKYSFHLGIAFQAKDDLNDATKTTDEMGKTAGIDAQNDKPTYFSLFGGQGTNKKIEGHIRQAVEAAESLPSKYDPIKFCELVEYLAAK